MRVGRWVVFVLGLWSLTALAKGPTFEAVSIRRNTSGAQVSTRMQGGRLTVINDPVGDLIRTAYGLEPFQIVDGPDWIGRERWDIVATAGRDVSPADVNAMLKSLLADRFGLVAHMAMREMRVYALVRSRDDGRLGPALHPSTADCAAITDARARGEQAGTTLCGYSGGTGEMVGGGRTMAQLARVLGGYLRSNAIDRTGLDGTFDFTLAWAPDSQPGAVGPSLFTAVQEQLGLKLESRVMPMDVLVIDAIEHPSTP